SEWGGRMLTGLRFKNWRSLRDVTIENLTPITVFVGANSSGKSNILDALHFVRYAENAGVAEAAFVWRAKEKARTIGVQIGSPIELKLNYAFADAATVAHTLTISFPPDSPLQVAEHYVPDDSLSDEKKGEVVFHAASFVKDRWQLLREGFSPPPIL